jgi:ABC-type multidrug transport system fused ATPase/permease subunit
MRKFSRLASSSPNVITRALETLSRKDKIKLALLSLIQTALSILDVVGVALIGIIGSLAVRGVQSNVAGDRTAKALSLLRIESFSLQHQIAILGILATSLLIVRTVMTAYFSRKSLFFLSRKAAEFSRHLLEMLLERSILVAHARSIQSTVYATTEGANAISLGIIANLIGLITDSFLLIILCVGLFLVDPLTALITISLFSIIGIILYLSLHVRAKNLGEKYSEFAIGSNEKIVEVLNSYREALVRGRRKYYTDEIGKLRLKLSENSAEMAFMPNISKYAIESSVILGALIISAIQFTLQDAARATGTLAVFLAAGSRIAPALMRVQQQALGMRSSIGSATPTLDLYDDLISSKLEVGNTQVFENIREFTPEVEIKELCYTYPGKKAPALEGIDFKIIQGSMTAFVGPSGAGKTTLADLILGVLQPTSGDILVSGQSPLDAIAVWPGTIAYVPQSIYISNSTIAGNISIGFPEENRDEARMWEVLQLANLADFVDSLPQKLDSHVGENGHQISGGQRQRLGIARALYTNPSLIVLDEATSALDSENESKISDAINRLKGKITIVAIAHRLSTIERADQVVYLKEGKQTDIGTFEEVMSRNPRLTWNSNHKFEQE